MQPGIGLTVSVYGCSGAFPARLAAAESGWWMRGFVAFRLDAAAVATRVA